MSTKNWEGYNKRSCGEHRTTGERARCFDCEEWCSKTAPCEGCREENRLRSSLAGCVSAVTIRRVPRFIWIRITVAWFDWTRPKSWWAVNLIHVRSVGPLRIATMRTDCVVRAKAAGRIT